MFLTTGQENSLGVLRLLLNKWDWLSELWISEARPFAYCLPLSGRGITRDPRVIARPELGPLAERPAPQPSEDPRP